ncbi:ATP-binding cassette domain-containing protein [Candidatus Omnitrophota bacterium]
MKISFTRLKKLFGTKIIALFIVTIFLGSLLGIIEMVFGFAIQNFLAKFNLIQTVNLPTVFSPFVALPIVFLIVVALIRFFLYFLHGFIPDLSYEMLYSRVRYLLSRALIGSDIENSAISVAEVSHITTNVTPKVGNFISSICQIVTAVFLILTILAGMFIISLRLTSVALIAICIMVLPTVLLKSVYQTYAGNYHKYLRQFSLKLIRDLRNIYFLRIVGTNQRESEQLNATNSTIFRTYVRYGLGIALNNTWPLFAGILVVIFTIWGNHNGNYLQSGMLVTFVYLLVRLPPSISQLARAFGHVQFSYPFVLNFLEYADFFLTENVSQQENNEIIQEETIPQSLRLQDLTVGRDEALTEKVTLSVKRGEFLLITGESGRGKTTLLMTILGIVPKIEGEINWNDIPLEQWSRKVFRKYIGYSGTDPFLIDTTIKENLLYGVRDRGRAEKSLDSILSVTCCSFIHEFEKGLFHKLGEAGEGISAGQKQRLSLARALLYNPSVLILDEATANIDEETEEKILQAMRAQYPDMTVIAVSHRDSLRKFATQSLQI